MHLLHTILDTPDTLHLGGEIDYRWRAAFRAVLQERARLRLPVLYLDMTEVEYLDSSGLGVLIEYHRDAQRFGGNLAICGLKPSLDAMFRVLRIEQFISLHPSVEEARSHFSRSPAGVAEAELKARL